MDIQRVLSICLWIALVGVSLAMAIALVALALRRLSGVESRPTAPTKRLKTPLTERTKRLKTLLMHEDWGVVQQGMHLAEGLADEPDVQALLAELSGWATWGLTDDWGEDLLVGTPGLEPSWGEVPHREGLALWWSTFSGALQAELKRTGSTGLGLSHWSSLVDVGALSRLQGLSWFVLDSCASLTDLSGLSGLSALKRLWVFEALSLTTADAVWGLSGLE